MRKVLAVFAVVLLAVGTLGAQAKTAKKIKIGFANINERSAFTKMVRNGIETEAKKRGWDIICLDNASDGATATTRSSGTP